MIITQNQSATDSLLRLEKWLTDFVAQRLKTISATEAPELAAEILFQEGLEKHVSNLLKMCATGCFPVCS